MYVAIKGLSVNELMLTKCCFGDISTCDNVITLVKIEQVRSIIIIFRNNEFRQLQKKRYKITTMQSSFSTKHFGLYFVNN